jgi:hypothetical protein
MLCGWDGFGDSEKLPGGSQCCVWPMAHVFSSSRREKGEMRDILTAEQRRGRENMTADSCAIGQTQHWGKLYSENLSDF